MIFSLNSSEYWRDFIWKPSLTQYYHSAKGFSKLIAGPLGPEAIEIIVDGDKFSVQFEGATFVGESIVEEAAIVDGVIQGHYLFDFDKYYFHFGPLNNGDGRGSLVLTGIAIEDLH